MDFLLPVFFPFIIGTQSIHTLFNRVCHDPPQSLFLDVNIIILCSCVACWLVSSNFFSMWLSKFLPKIFENKEFGAKHRLGVNKEFLVKWFLGEGGPVVLIVINSRKEPLNHY